MSSYFVTDQYRPGRFDLVEVDRVFRAQSFEVLLPAILAEQVGVDGVYVFQRNVIRRWNITAFCGLFLFRGSEFAGWLLILF